MAIAPGAHLGPYEILSALGAGGMGDVYRARDTRLQRSVAVKVLRAHLAGDVDRRVRFQREAQAISSLNHSHICTLYHVGHQDGVDYLVMELLEGQPLNERLARGALPVDLAVHYAIQIAGALDAAHRKGIVHRDLKPANVFLVRGGGPSGPPVAKLLDFGIARLAAPVAAAAATSETLTAEGTLLGTPQYMAPEQLEGRDVDARGDIFAFGAVLFEMLTGTRAFAGESQSSVIAAVLEREPPPLTVAQPQTPIALDRIVRKCLAKNPDERWQSARDLRDNLQWIVSGPLQAVERPATKRSLRLLGWSAALLLLMATIALGFFASRGSTVDTRVYRSTFVAPAPLSTVLGLSVSPDGRRIAFTAPDATGRVVLWIRSLDGLSAEPLAGTEGAGGPFWSPDSRSIAFSANGKLRRIDASGGPAVSLADAISSLPGAWGSDDSILFSPNSGISTLGTPIARVSASGGSVSFVTAKDPNLSELMHGLPCFLPDGRHFLFTTFVGRGAGAVYAGSLDSNKRTKVLDGVTNAQYAGGMLFFVRDAALTAQTFDATALRLKGEPMPLAEHVWTVSPTMAVGAYAVSATGVLVFQGGGSGYGKSRLTWFDRTGHQIGVLGDEEDYEGVTANNSAEVSLSPDGSHATAVITGSNAQPDIWIFDVARGTRMRLTTDPAGANAPVWSPDGNTILYRSTRNQQSSLYRRRADGAGAEELVPSDQFGKIPESWSPDGRYLLYYMGGPAPVATQDVWVLPMFGAQKPFPFVQSPFNDRRSQFSPDGRWVAYQSNESGRFEVYIVPFPGPGGKTQVSTEGGREPRWGRDGKEIFYLAGTTLTAAAVTTAAERPAIGKATRLFELRTPRGANEVYDVAPDGRRFLVDVAAEQPSDPITVVVNWPALLKKN